VKLLIDADLPYSLGRELGARGHDVFDARGLLPQPAPDEMVYQRAVQDGRILLTRDLDFSNILRFQPKAPVGIVILRLRMLSPAEVLTSVENLFKQLTQQQLQGAITIVQPGRYRRRVSQ
jgi:predicted nuclease of predicted toxin-antitoxin system